MWSLRDGVSKGVAEMAGVVGAAARMMHNLHTPAPQHVGLAKQAEASGRLQRIDCEGPVAVVGDIHGRLDLLEKLLDAIGNVPLICLGDLCDRGPSTKGVIDRLISVGARSVKGNHDLWLTEWANGRGFDAFALHPGMGGDATLRSYGVYSGHPERIAEEYEKVPREHAAWLDALPMAIDLHVDGNPYWLLHTGIPNHFNIPAVVARRRQNVVPWLLERVGTDMLWVATMPEDMVPLDRPVLFGHVPRRQAVDLGHVVALDTGAGAFRDGGRLTAMILPEKKLISVE